MVGGLELSNKPCSSCGVLNDTTSLYCNLCGNKITYAPTEKNSETESPNTLILNNSRIVYLTIITFGAYILYWLYLTWKQMDTETENAHYPVWHSLTFLVPFYGLFRLYNHLQTIETLTTKEDIQTHFSPLLSLILIILNFMLAMTSYGDTRMFTILVVEIIQITLIIKALLSAQASLNLYWYKTKGTNVTSALFDRTEIGFILLIYSLFALVLIV